MLDTGGRFTRGFKPKWSERVYKVGRIDGAFVYDTEGNEYPSKFTQPVVGNVEELPSRRFEQGGSVQAEEKKRRVLGGLAEVLKNWMGSRRLSLSEIGVFLSQRGGFRNLAREARLNMKAPVLNFLKAFPDKFDITSNRAGQAYAIVKRGELAFTGARRLRRLL